MNGFTSGDFHVNKGNQASDNSWRLKAGPRFAVRLRKRHKDIHCLFTDLLGWAVEQMQIALVIKLTRDGTKVFVVEERSGLLLGCCHHHSRPRAALLVMQRLSELKETTE